MGKLFTKSKKRISILTVLFMMMTLAPSPAVAVTASDISGHWAQTTIQIWVDQGTIKGYEDGTFRPENNISRAEFMTLVNGIFGYTEVKATSYTDVKADAWYADAVGKAAAAGYITGYPDGTMRPDNSISREEAANIIMKINKLIENASEANIFTDASTLVWSKGAVGAVNFAGIMIGYPDGSFQPKNSIKRGEAVFALDKSLTFSKNNVIYDKVGTYGPETGDLQVTGNVIVRVSGTVLQNMVISGDLIIDQSVGDGNVTLINVTVKGETKIYGGGINSIIVIDSTLGKVTISKADGKIRIVVSGNTTVGTVTLNSGATLEESNLTGGSAGFQEIIIDAEDGDIIILIGSFTDVEINSPGITLEMPAGTTIENLTINEKTEITGTGVVDNAYINVSGVTFETAPTKMVVAPGVTAPVIVTPATGGGGGHRTAVTGITITGEIVVASDAALQLSANITPGNATNKNLTWSLINGTGGATIDADGLLTVTTEGTITVTAISQSDSSVEDTKQMKVYKTIQAGIAGATTGDTINVAAGTYTEVGQIHITKDLTIVGANMSTTIIKPNADTGASGDSKGWWLVDQGKVFNLSGVTLDGTGKKIFQGIRHKGTGMIQNVHFTGITYNASGPDYAGFAIYAFGMCGAVDVSGCVFDNIGREGIAYWGAGTTGTYTGNTYTGKGLGNWLDYGVEVTNGAAAIITDSTITNNLGTATSDGSNSAAIIVLLDSSTATITNNTITGNDIAIKVGYDDPVSSAMAYVHSNKIFGNISGSLHGTTGGAFDASNNWWGNATGPNNATSNPSGTGDKVGDNVIFSPWYTNESMTTTATAIITDADVSITSGSIVFQYSFDAGSNTLTYGNALGAPYYLNTTGSTVTLTNGISSSAIVSLSALSISSEGAVSYASAAAVQSQFAGLNFVPTQVFLNLAGGVGINAWIKEITVTLDQAEISLLAGV